MTARSFLQNQVKDQQRAKLAALPTNDALNLLFGQKQALDASLTTLSGKTIGAKGLDLLAASTSAVAINALGGSGGQIVSAMVASLDAAKLTGTIDVARLPVIPGNNSLSATSIAGLTTLQQAAVSLGTMVYTADGGAWRYSGSGSKTAEASYYYTADVTPEWNAIANKPALASAAQGALADTALQPGASVEVLTEGATKKLLTTAERTKLSGVAAGATANATDASLRDRALHTGEQEITTITGLIAALAAKFDNAGGVLTGDLTIQHTAPFLVLNTPDAQYAGIKIQNSSGQFEWDIDPSGNLVLVNRAANGGLENFPLVVSNAGVITFSERPYYGNASDATRLITYAEAQSLVGGGAGSGGAVASVFGRTGLIDARAGDYSIGQISGAADALAAKSDNFDTINGGSF